MHLSLNSTKNGILQFWRSDGSRSPFSNRFHTNLPNSPISAHSNTVTANQPSPPGTAIVWVNALWLISLVLSLTCALIAMLLQQWARRYTETLKSTNMLRHRARVRLLLLIGTNLYNIPLIVEIIPTLRIIILGGLMIIFHVIHKMVAIIVDVAVGVLGLAYIVLSILPCLVKCPYRTPISKILWYPCHALLPFAARLQVHVVTFTSEICPRKRIRLFT